MSTTKISPCEEENLKACPCVGGTLDKLVQPAILAVLAVGPIHGYRLLERLAAMPSFAGHKPDASGIYRLLKSMESRKLVVSSLDASRAGPTKRTYQITPDGEECLHVWVQTLEEYRNRIASLLRTARNAAKSA